MTFDECDELPEKSETPVDYAFIKSAIFPSPPHLSSEPDIIQDQPTVSAPTHIPTISSEEMQPKTRKISQNVSFKNRGRSMSRHTIKARQYISNLMDKDADFPLSPTALEQKQEVV